VVDGFEPVTKLASMLGSTELKKLELNNVMAKFKIANGRLNVSPFDIKAKGMVMNVAGSNGIDQTMDYNLGLNVPRAMLGAKANDAANTAIAALNSKVGTNVAMGETVKVNAVLGGTFLKPNIKLKYGAGEGTAKAAVNAVVEEKKAELQAKAEEKVDTLKKKAVEKATTEIGKKLGGLFKKKAEN